MNRDDAPPPEPLRARLRPDIIIMLVLFIGPIAAGLTMGLLGVTFSDLFSRDYSHWNRCAMNQMKEIQKGLELFRLETGAYPDHLDELEMPTPDCPRGYLPGIPLDPWKREYVYRCIPDGTISYVLLSRGPDGVADTDDDTRLETQW